MNPTLFALVAAAAVMHAGWNFVAKAAADRLIGVYLIEAASTLVLLPALIVYGLPAQQTWVWLGVSSLVHVGYILALAEAYERVDLSVAYPIIRGVAPVIVTVISLTPLVGDTIAPLGFVGIGFIAAAVLTLAGRADRVGLLVAVAAGFCIAGYTILDGIGVRQGDETFGNAVSYIAAMFILQFVLLNPVVLKRRGITAVSSQLKSNVMTVVGAGFASSLGYLFVTYAARTAPLGLVSGLRETSTVFGVILSVAFLGERVLRVQWVAIIAAASGVVLIALA